MTFAAGGLDRNASEAERNQLFMKTKLCKFEARGMCAKGPKCPFAHGQGELRDLPDLRRTKLCAEYMKTGECTRRNCTFAHSKAELRSAGRINNKAKREEQWQGHSVSVREPAWVPLLGASNRSNMWEDITQDITPVWASSMSPDDTTMVWTPMLGSEDETVDSDGSPDYYGSGAFDSPDVMAMFNPSWALASGGYGCIDSSAAIVAMPMHGALLTPNGGFGNLGEEEEEEEADEGDEEEEEDGDSFTPVTALDSLEAEPAYVPLQCAASMATAPVSVCDWSTLDGSVDMDPSNGVWTVKSVLQDVLSN